MNKLRVISVGGVLILIFLILMFNCDSFWQNDQHRVWFQRMSSLHSNIIRSYFKLNFVYFVARKENGGTSYNTKDDSKIDKNLDKMKSIEAAELVAKNLLSKYNNYSEKGKYTYNVHEIRIILNSKNFRLGEDIIFTVKLYDKNKEHIPQGGAVLQLWVEEEVHHARVNGYVVDHENGSYTGHVRALWNGNPKLFVSLITNKEEIGIYLHKIKDMEYFSHNFVTYASGNIREVSMCNKEKDKYRQGNEYCKITRQGYDIYCARPSMSNLGCDDVVMTHNKGSGSNRIVSTLSDTTRSSNDSVRSFVTLNVDGDQNTFETLKLPCSKWPTLITWWDQVPSGFFYENQWHHASCQQRIFQSKDSMQKCLLGKSVLLHGDSTIKEMFSYILKITETFYNRQLSDSAPGVVMVDGLHLVYSPNTQGKHIVSFSSQLEEIFNNSTLDIILLQLHIHSGQISPGIHRAFVRDARRELDDILKNNPDVKIFVSGPYALKTLGKSPPLDFINKFQEQIIFEELHGIHNKIIYLDHWDVTLAAGGYGARDYGNSRKPITASMVDIFLSYLCS